MEKQVTTLGDWCLVIDKRIKSMRIILLFFVLTQLASAIVQGHFAKKLYNSDLKIHAVQTEVMKSQAELSISHEERLKKLEANLNK